MRHIKLTEELKQKALKEFQEKLFNERFSDSKINFSFDLKNDTKLEDKDKVIVNVRTDAWLKMWTLVASESGEIGWHGTVNRISDKIFEITDIILYPQFVTGITVQTDDVGYGNWLHKELDEDTFNHLRFHGHSHVNMTVSPSGVDTNWYNDILQSLTGNDFYIFTILNKREDMFIEIYDLATNTIYEKKDIIINVVMTDNNYLQNWIVKSKEKALQERVKTGFTTASRLDGYKKLEDVKPFDAEEDEKENLRDIVLNVTASDLKDEGLRKALVDGVNSLAPFNMYFGAGWLRWQEASDYEKIDLAQDYWVLKNPNNAAKFKKKKGRPKKTSFSWEDYYDKYR